MATLQKIENNTFSYRKAILEIQSAILILKEGGCMEF
jgi:hypothetical protein